MTNRSNTNSNTPPTQPVAGGLSWKWIVLSVVIACGVGGIAVGLFEVGRARQAEQGKKKEVEELIFGKKDRPLPNATTYPQQLAKGLAESNFVDDDGRTLWASPTIGTSIDLAYLPPGSQIIVALHPAGISQLLEGARVLAALGPLGQRAVEYVESATLWQFGAIESLVVSFQAASSGDWLTALVAHVNEPLTADSLLTKLNGATPENHAGKKYWLAGGRAYYLPVERDGRVLVVAPPALIADIIDLAGAPPPLRRDIERLLAHTDSDRAMTIIAAPNFFFGEGQGMFKGQMAPLREPLFWFLGDGLSAVALSMNWDENFFVELAAIPTLDLSPDKAANQLMERVRQMPELLEDYVLKLNLQPYGRRVVARFPMMIRKMASYTRSGVEGGCVLLRCYLPAVAGHNLIMGAELTLAETKSRPGHLSSSSDAQTEPSKNGPVRISSVRERLARKTSLSFARDSLEAALEQLSQDIGVEIVIVGPDLQADGITRNQQLGMHAENTPAADVLVEILRKANPDKTATSATDPRQKLVYVIKPKSPGGEEAVFVTTRARAAERGEELPAVFLP